MTCPHKCSKKLIAESSKDASQRRPGCGKRRLSSTTCDAPVPGLALRFHPAAGSAGLQQSLFYNNNNNNILWVLQALEGWKVWVAGSPPISSCLGSERRCVFQKGPVAVLPNHVTHPLCPETSNRYNL